MVSAGHVHNPSAEVATGQVNESLLRKVSELSGGTYLESTDDELELVGSDVSRYIEFLPLLLKIFLGLFVLDLLVRRWENVLGVFDQVGAVFRGKTQGV